jgi:thiol-disulfide isomerase/thioredoxin
MTATPSTMLALGTTMPVFRLPSTTGEIVSSESFASRPLLVAFICHHCPFVRHIRREFSRFATEFQERGVAIVGINSNDTVAFPEDGPAGNAVPATQKPSIGCNIKWQRGNEPDY